MKQAFSFYPAVLISGFVFCLSPLRAQFVEQEHKIAPAGGFRSLALSADGNTAVVGIANDNEAPRGEALVFARSSGSWIQQAKLVGTTSSGGGNQGFSVAISGDGNTVIIGGPADYSDAGVVNGAAWIFTRNNDSWTQQGSKLVGTGGNGFGQQGYAVAISGDGNTAMIGAPSDNSQAGSIWVFTRANGAWTQQGSKLTPADSVGSANFGASLALSNDGNTALVGGPDDDDQGAAWIFTRNNGSWTQQGSKLVGTGSVGWGGQGGLWASLPTATPPSWAAL